jgi:serine/threonine protein kinase
MSSKSLLISEPQAKSWANQMSLGLHYLHQQNIIDGDIKLDNVLLFSGYN